MIKEKNKIIINPYVYAGIDRFDIPSRFKKYNESVKIKYTQDMITSSIEEVLDIKFHEIQSKYRFRPLVEARQMYCYLVRTYLKWSYKMIGQSIGSRDHSTIMYNVETFGNLSYTDSDYRDKANKIKQLIEWKYQNSI